MTEQRPREFALAPCGQWATLDDDYRLHDDDIYVIEYSAYEAMRKERDELLWEIEHSVSEYSKARDEVKAFHAKLATAKAALELYANADEDSPHKPQEACKALGEIG